MGDPSRKVLCPTHGESHATYLCQHLVRGEALAFIVGEEDEDSERPDAWCEACDLILMEDGEWTDRGEAFAGVTLLCSFCYDEIKGAYL